MNLVTSSVTQMELTKKLDLATTMMFSGANHFECLVFWEKTVLTTANHSAAD